MTGTDDLAVTRFRLLRPFLEDGMPLAAVARAAGVPLSTAKRWVRRYRTQGLDGLTRRSRLDKGSPRVLLPPLQELIEGLALRKPRRSVAGIARVVADAARERGWAVPGSSALLVQMKQCESCDLVGNEGSLGLAPRLLSARDRGEA